MKQNLNELQEFKQQSIEASKLAVALQGEKVSASRAVSQNKDLKIQLEEMPDSLLQLVRLLLYYVNMFSYYLTLTVLSKIIF